MEFADIIADYIAAQAEINAAEIERACEQAVQDGTCGVTVTQHPDGHVTAAPDELIPYGVIYWFKGEPAWVAPAT